MPDMYKTRFTTIYKKGIEKSADGAAAGRIYTLKKGIELFKDNPALGVGPGNFPLALEEIGSTFVLNSHNIYGTLLGETGTLGTFAFFLMVGSIFFSCKQISKSASLLPVSDGAFLNILSNACNQTLILLLVNGLFGSNLYRYTWLLIAAITVLSYNFVKEKELQLSS